MIIVVAGLLKLKRNSATDEVSFEERNFDAICAGDEVQRVIIRDRLLMAMLCHGIE
jgi:hypothetical protein